VTKPNKDKIKQACNWQDAINYNKTLAERNWNISGLKVEALHIAVWVGCNRHQLQYEYCHKLRLISSIGFILYFIALDYTEKIKGNCWLKQRIVDTQNSKKWSCPCQRHDGIQISGSTATLISKLGTGRWLISLTSGPLCTNQTESWAGPTVGLEEKSLTPAANRLIKQ
jgi:hypothetical protein